MVHIQVLLYKSERHIENLVKGLNILQGDFMVHFWDNSNEDSDRIILKYSPTFDYTFDKSSINSGFGRGHNSIFKKYGNTYSHGFLLLNPDCIPFFDSLVELDSFVVRVSQDKWGIIELEQFPLEHPKDFAPNFEVEWASGAAMYINTAAFKTLGGFDDNIFMYCEDVDLSWRMQIAGYKLYISTKSKIVHVTQSMDDAKSPEFEQVYSIAGNLYLRYKFFGLSEVNDYARYVYNSPYWERIQKIYSEASQGLSLNDLKNFRGSNIKIYPDTNYAKHRW